MIRWIVESSLRLRLLMVVLAAVLIGVGITQARKMPVDVFPEFNPPLVEVQTEALGLSAEEVEQLITVPMEQDLLNGVPWLRQIRSQSVPGLSSIVLIFDNWVELGRARQMVTERLSQAFALPHVSKPPTMLQPLSATNRVMMIGLSSKTLSLIEMSVQARWTIGPRLMGVPGVANVAIWGQNDRQLQVQVDPKKLSDKKVTLLQVLETTGNAMWVSSLSFLEASTPGTGGFIDTANQRLGIRHILPISSPEGLAKVPVEDSKLLLGDVATIVEDHQPLIGDALNQDGSSLLLVVEKLPGANTLEVTAGLEEVLEAMRPGLPGVELDSSVFRPADFIGTVISNLRNALLWSIILLLVVLLAFFFSWRTALISLVAIPVSLMTAVLVLAWRGATLNMMLLAGLMIAIGVVIDDAVVDVDAMARRLRQPRPAGKAPSAAALILEATIRLRTPLIVATVVSLLPLAPLFMLEGRVNAFLQPVLWAYGLAVLASLLVAMTITPTLALLLLSKTKSSVLESDQPEPDRNPSPLVRSLQAIYQALLSFTLRVPVIPYAVLVVIGALALLTLPALRVALLPTFHEPSLLIHLDGAPGTSRPEMDRIVARMSADLRALAGVQAVGAHVGRAIMSDQVVDVNASDLWVNINPAADYNSTVAAVRQTVASYPGFKHSVGSYLNDRGDGVFAGTADPIGVRIYGENTALLRSTAEAMKQELAKVEGVTDLRVKRQTDEPTVEVEVDLAAAQRYGIKPGDVRRAATTLLSGLQVGALFEESKVFDVVVWGTPEIRNSLTSIQELLIDTPSGKPVRLGDVAAVRIVPVPSTIQREGVSRYIDITFKAQGRALDALATDLKQRLAHIPLPLEFHAEVIGDYAEQQALRNRLIGFGVAAAIAIFLLLQVTFVGWRLTITFCVLLLIALLGGVLTAYISGGVLSLGSLFGLLALFGLAVRNGVLLIDRYQVLQQDKHERLGVQAILLGARDRLAPSLLTVFATVLVLLPLALGGSRPGFEILQPLAVVMLGGLVTTTIFNLFVVPSLYLRFGHLLAADENTLDLSPEPSLEMAAD